MAELSISVNPRIHNKPPVWLSEYASGWQQQQVSIAGLQAVIAAGAAIVAAAMTSDHRSSEAFLHADLAVVDIDHGLDLEGFAAHPLSSYAAFTYTTSSHRDQPGHHRFRVVFRLPERIHDPGLYKALITLLIRALGGDKNCTDPCRLFYGCDHGQQQLYHPDATLPGDLITEAEQQHQRERDRFRAAASDYDEITLQQAGFVLEQVLTPTADGERDQFIRITAAAASAGEALYPAWADWASRGHHGQGRNARQTSERFFRGFSGRSTLATLFYLASEQNPGWRATLPDDLRSTGFNYSVAAVGYSHEDFLGHHDDDHSTPQILQRETTGSLFEVDGRQWAELNAPARPSTAPEAQENQPRLEPPEPPFDDDGDDSDFDDSEDPLRRRRGRPPKQRPGAGGKGDSEDEVELIRTRLLSLYPDLRLNVLSLQLEYGPRDAPQVIHDPTVSYMMISRGLGRILPKSHVYDAAQIIGWQNRYNPVRSYLEACAASSEPIEYFDHLASTLLGVAGEGPDNPRMPSGELFADVVLRRFLVGAVARTLNPGCSHGWMPILVGPQNLGKSNFFQYLTPPTQLNGTYPWVSTVQQSITYLKDKPHALHAGWIVLLDEVERYFQRRHTEELKNLITVSVDRSARKWENERSYPRAFVLAGGTNTATFMVDPTGNRRFMPIHVLGRVPSPEDPNVKIIDLDRIKQDRDRIWSAAYRAYMDKPVHEFSSYELAHIADYLNAFTVDTPLQEAIRRVLERGSSFLYEGRPAYTMCYIFERLDLGLESLHNTTKAVSDELRKMGYLSLQRRINGRSVRFWTLDPNKTQGPNLYMPSR